MAKKQTDEDKIKDGKKAVKDANRKKTQNRVAKETQRLADREVLKIAEELPAGVSKKFLTHHASINKLEEQRRAINAQIRAERAGLKELKIDLAPYDQVRKLLKMDPADARAYKASEALYAEKLGLELSKQDSLILDDVKKRADEAREAFAGHHGDDAGKEVGSGTAENDVDDDSDDAPSIPERNESLSASASVTH